MEMDSQKFLGLVHLIIHDCKDPDQLGKTKLHKILWFSEALAYLNWGNSITGEQFVKDKYGPVAMSLNFVLRHLLFNRKINIDDVPFFEVRKEQYQSLTEPDRSQFEEKELTLIGDVARQICEEHTAGTISELSHNRIWEVAERWEDLPHQSLFMAKKGELTESEWDKVKREIAARA